MNFLKKYLAKKGFVSLVPTDTEDGWADEMIYKLSQLPPDSRKAALKLLDKLLQVQLKDADRREEKEFFYGQKD